MGTLVTKADTVAAKGMLDHAFRNTGPRALRDVAFGDIALAFAHHRFAETADLLHACQQLLDDMSEMTNGSTSGNMATARAAIARATGAGA